MDDLEQARQNCLRAVAAALEVAMEVRRDGITTKRRAAGIALLFGKGGTEKFAAKCEALFGKDAQSIIDEIRSKGGD